MMMAYVRGGDEWRERAGVLAAKTPVSSLLEILGKTVA